MLEISYIWLRLIFPKPLDLSKKCNHPAASSPEHSMYIGRRIISHGWYDRCKMVFGEIINVNSVYNGQRMKGMYYFSSGELIWP